MELKAKSNESFKSKNKKSSLCLTPRSLCGRLNILQMQTVLLSTLHHVVTSVNNCDYFHLGAKRHNSSFLLFVNFMCVFCLSLPLCNSITPTFLFLFFHHFLTSHKRNISCLCFDIIHCQENLHYHYFIFSSVCFLILSFNAAPPCPFVLNKNFTF